MDKQYTNVLSPEVLTGMDKSPLSEEDLSVTRDERVLIETHEDYRRQHPIIAIWRQTMAGSHLDNGDKLISSPQEYAVLVYHAGETMPDDFLASIPLTAR